MKLRTRIQLYIIVTLVILLLVANMSIYFLFRQVSLHNSVDRLHEQGRALAETAATVDWKDTSRTSLFQADLPTEGMVRFIGSDGKSEGVITRAEKYRELPFTFTSQEQDQTFHRDGSWYAEVSIPVIRDNGIYSMQVVEELVSLQQTFQVLKYSLTIAGLIILIPSLLGGRLLGNFLLRPILALTSTMQTIRKSGKWKRMETGNRTNDELQTLSDTFNEMVDQLEENFTKQQQFVSDASHELKTPISIIKSYSKLLDRWGADDPAVQQEAVQAIHGETERMQALVDQLLILAKDDPALLQKEAVDLGSIAESCAAAMETAHQREIMVHTERNIVVRADANMLKQVVYILLSNSIKYSDDRIEIAVKSIRDEAILSVTDFGEGLDEQDQRRIFDRFYRVDKARTREKGGSGLGLAIAKQLVELHDGKIEVNSILEKGSTFTIRLPL
ncbi:HAMP domain-containing sensor histidine kinase [Terribacillus sp. 179-K 1B1 HS]|uniref:sensor histidine kinase n=1 Tax=Terribacillus sp. 179-K 1B1 HS TaxID=3142388 RepID=UPI00399EF18E